MSDSAADIGKRVVSEMTENLRQNVAEIKKRRNMIPEISESELALMRLVNSDPSMSVFSQTSPKPTDPAQDVVTMKQAEEDAERLVSLGFLKEITSDHQEQIDKLGVDTGRLWRVFQVTAMGRAMFGVVQSTTVH